MTPQEKALIDSVFDRLAQMASTTKDAEALTYIRDRAASQPDATYGLVQAVLIQEMALNHANTRITQLEHELAQGAEQGQGSSFLGGAATGAGPWGPRATQPQPQQAPQPQYQQPQYQQPQYQAQPQYQQPTSAWGAPAGGGFLRNAAGMAAGVAGGTLLAEGIASLFGGRHLFGGGYGGFGGVGGGYGGGQPEMVENVENITVNNYGDANTAAARDGLPQTDDAGYQDASDDSSSFDGGGFDDGGGSDFSDT